MTIARAAPGGIGAPVERWKGLGWHVVDSTDISLTPETYKSYVERSRGEFSVAKHGYVASRSGWFSERSACYMATGRPVVVQNTGFSTWLPTGGGPAAVHPHEAVVDLLIAQRQIHPSIGPRRRKLRRFRIASANASWTTSCAASESPTITAAIRRSFGASAA